LTPEVADFWQRAGQALQTAEALVESDPDASAWLASLRYTGDYGGQEHVSPEDARTAVERARLVLDAVRDRLAP
jgi:HEPN domain-containing protein